MVLHQQMGSLGIFLSRWPKSRRSLNFMSVMLSFAIGILKRHLIKLKIFIRKSKEIWQNSRLYSWRYW